MGWGRWSAFALSPTVERASAFEFFDQRPQLRGVGAPTAETLCVYRLLNLRYGEKFTPQDMNHLEPLPSGILGPLRLISEQDAKQEVNQK